MEDFQTIQEIILKARQTMPAELWDHVTGGSESETTLNRNRQALDSIAFRPRVLRDVSEIDTSAHFLNRKMRIPAFLAPIGGIDRIWKDGAAISLKAAADFGTVCFQSSINPLTIGEASRISKDSNVFQLYVQGDNDWIDAFIDKANQNSCKGFCLTLDTALYSRRERDLFNRYAPKGREKGEREGFKFQSMMTWDFVDKVKDKLNIPLIAKGIATAEDAGLAVEHNIDMIYISNHGGRQLDHGRGAVEVLPEIVEAVEDRAEVVIDGGFMRGSDIIKAIAMGAAAVGIGKLYVLALAAAGEEGVVRMLEILENEISTAMGLLGVTSLDQLNPGYLHEASPVKYPAEFSPFPSIEKKLHKE